MRVLPSFKGTQWLVSCDANISPEDFKKSLRCQSRHMIIEVPGEGISRDSKTIEVAKRMRHIVKRWRVTKAEDFAKFGQTSGRFP